MLSPCNWSHSFKCWKQLSGIAPHRPGKKKQNHATEGWLGITGAHMSNKAARRAKLHKHMQKELEQKRSTGRPIIVRKNKIITITSSNWIANKKVKIINEVCNGVVPQKLLQLQQLPLLYLSGGIKGFITFISLSQQMKIGSLVFSVTLKYQGMAWAQNPPQKF